MTCWECGSDGPLHQHHVVPRSRGGTRTLPLCERCHGLVHDRDLRNSELTRAALAAKRGRGERIGQVPFGSQLAADGRTLVDDPREQAVIREIRELRAAGMSIRAIVATVNAELDAGRTIHKSMVERLLKGAASGPPPCPALRAPAPPRASEPAPPAPGTPATR